MKMVEMLLMEIVKEDSTHFDLLQLEAMINVIFNLGRLMKE